ncbi:relaxase/mobilization nuclease domain-containing protein [Pedobacter sp. GSP4]|uniref:relaxase/mobilization nuclease domain-containing protein n=1 Tax=Pedobacter sp. GSP4 TaxID=3453716 RepID=UPI003EEF44E1
MVAKIESGKSIRGILYYNEDKVAILDARLIMASGFAGDIEKMNFSQKLNRFKHLTDLNAAVKTNALHISLNFDASDKFNNEKLQQIASEYMERIGFGDQPFLVYRHEDSAHPHIHIATTNIQKDGQRIDVHGIGYRLSEPARKEIEIKYGLVRAEGREMKQGRGLRPAIYGDKPTKQQIAGIVTGVMRQYHYTSFEQYNAILELFNIKADRGAEGTRMFENKGLLYSILDHKGKQIGIPVKASQIYYKPTLGNLEKRFEAGKKKREPHKQEMKELIDHLFFRFRYLSEARFREELLKDRIDVVFRSSEKGQLYGVTYIDHANKTVFNGSDLGKVYSARALSLRFEKAQDNLSLSQDKTKLSWKQDAESLQIHQPTCLKLPDRTGFLETLMAQTQAERSFKVPKRRKKRKKGRIIDQDQQLTL